jgi:hypothetical protein
LLVVTSSAKIVDGSHRPRRVLKSSLKAASALRDPRTMKAGPSPVMLATMRVVELMRWSLRNAVIVVDDDVMRNDGCRAGQ